MRKVKRMLLGELEFADFSLQFVRGLMSDAAAQG